MADKRSTNAKLADIINSNKRDKAEEDDLIKEELAAKARLRRTALYGIGARAMIPKVKTSKVQDWSPFTVSETITEPLKPKPLEHSIPPGAHTDQYRAVTNLTRKSYNDPDRIFINSSTMVDGIHRVSQPPWYVGNNNKVEPPDTSFMMAANRYGYRGANKIMQYNTKMVQNPSKTQNEHIPKFLTKNHSFIDEWAPPILASTYQTVNSIETPKLWPENAEYVTGFPKKNFKASSWIYNRETTVTQNLRPQSSEAMDKLMNSIKSQDDLLRDYSKLESKQMYMSLPMTQQQSFESSWRDEVKKQANDTLKSTLKTSMRKNTISREPHTLMDPSDTIRYSGSTALIIHTQTTDELKFRLRMQKSKSKNNTPFTLKWNTVINVFMNIKTRLKKNQTMAYAIFDIAEKLQQCSLTNGSQTTLSRIDFLQLCQKVGYFSDIPEKNLSLLYSVFDPMKHNNFRYIEFINLLILLNKPEKSTYNKLKYLWFMNIKFGYDRNLFDIALSILSCCCMNNNELKNIETLFFKEFRTKCYELSLNDIGQMRSNYDIADDLSVDSVGPYALPVLDISKSANHSRVNTAQSSSLGLSSSLPGSAPGTANSNNINGSLGITIPIINYADMEEDELLKHKMNDRNLGTSIQPQYNICEHYLDQSTFIKILRFCPSLFDSFDKCLSNRLIACYGQDIRIIRNSDGTETIGEVGEADNRDFSWILTPKNKSKSKPGTAEVTFSNTIQYSP
eukprot:gene6719-9212_t